MPCYPCCHHLLTPKSTTETMARRPASPSSEGTPSPWVRSAWTEGSCWPAPVSAPWALFKVSCPTSTEPTLRACAGLSQCGRGCGLDVKTKTPSQREAEPEEEWPWPGTRNSKQVSQRLRTFISNLVLQEVTKLHSSGLEDRNTSFKPGGFTYNFKIFRLKVCGPPFIFFPWALQKLGTGRSYSLIVSALGFLWSLLLSCWPQQILDHVTSPSSPHLSRCTHTVAFVITSNGVPSKTYLSNILDSDTPLTLIFPS